MARASKTKKILQSLTEKQKNDIGLEIEHLVANELKWITNKCIENYSYVTKECFGWDRDDLLQEIKLSYFRALATYNPKMAKVTTHCCTILRNDMINLSIKCKRYKWSLTKLSFPGTDFMASKQSEFERSSDDWMEFSEGVTKIADILSSREEKLLNLYISKGVGIKELSDKLSLPIEDVKKSIVSIQEKLENYMG